MKQKINRIGFTKSVKRIVWTIGWSFIFLMNDIVIVLQQDDLPYSAMVFYNIFMCLVLILPLLIFEDD